MSSLSKTLVKKINLLFCSVLFFFYFMNLSLSNEEEYIIENWIEDIPILTSLIKKKKDVVEFDSSNGKIISITFDVKNLSKKQIYSFYKGYFKNNNWKKIEDENVWIIKSKTFKKKIFKIEKIEKSLLKIKIIKENF